VSAANEIARGLVTAPYRTGGQAQYLPKTSGAAHGETLAATRATIELPTTTDRLHAHRFAAARPSQFTL
jgi:hypothetical protein